MKYTKKFIICTLVLSMIIGNTHINASAKIYKYYNKLTDTQKAAYKQMEKELNKSDGSDALVAKLSCSYLDSLRMIEALTADRPDLFSGNLTIDANYTEASTEITLAEKSGKALAKKLRNIVKKADVLGDDDFETVKNIHDWLLKRIKYDYSPDNDKQMDKFSMKGALINRLAVCEGYARTFKYLCDVNDIQCVLVTGYSVDPSTGASNDRHMWNYVRLDDSWYAVDSTWDDTIYENDEIAYDYFLVGSATKDSNGISFNKSHLREKEFLNFEEKGLKGFKYPSLSKESYFGNENNIYSYMKEL